jgi:hypothetical protein
MLRWLDRLPLAPLVVAAVVLGFSPLLPEPHLLQKLGLLFKGQLDKPIDWLDLLMHASLPLLLVLKWIRSRQIHHHHRR